MPEPTDDITPDDKAPENAIPGAAIDNVEPAEDAADSFPRSYVEELRNESKEHRNARKTAEDRADTLSKRLHTALVAATGRLENPADLPFDADHLDDGAKLAEAIEALLKDRPYLAKRAFSDAGQGNRGEKTAGLSWASLFSN